MATGDVTRLTEGQKTCLRMVYRHMSSKDIARELLISHHTVDQRIRLAIQHLGVTSRIEAAKLLAAHENGELYQPAVYQSSQLVQQREQFENGSAPTGGEQSSAFVDRSVAQEEPNKFPVDLGSAYQRNRWPFPLVEGERNELNLIERLGWIAMIAIGAALAFGMILAGMDALSRLI
jgi:DNA-binding CsgD family transcriptional regulator